MKLADREKCEGQQDWYSCDATDLPKFVVTAAVFRLAGGLCNRAGYLIQDGHDVDCQPAAGIGTAHFPFQKIESPFPNRVHDNEIIAAIEDSIFSVASTRPWFAMRKNGDGHL